MKSTIRASILASLFALLCTAQPLAFVDRYQSTLASGYTSGGGTLAVASATGLPSGSTYFFLTVLGEGANTEEVMLCTSRSGTTLTVTGAQAGTSASNHASGAVVRASIMTAAAFAQLKTDAVTGVSTTVNGQTCTLGSTCTVLPAILVSTSGPVSDPGGAAAYQFNNASGALTFNAPAGVAGYQRCYRNATGKTGAITIQMAASNTVDVGGTNGTSAGTLVSSGAAGDAVCLVSDATNHWYAFVQSGSWTNN